MAAAKDLALYQFRTNGSVLPWAVASFDPTPSECLRCFRIAEIQRVDAIRLYGADAAWKDIGRRLLDNGCQHRTGGHEEDRRWPDCRS